MTHGNLFQIYLAALGVPHTRAFTREAFESHPYKYTLFGIRRLLSSYGVPSDALRLDDKAALTRLPLPFMAQMDGDLAVVRSVGDAAVVVDRADGRRTLSRDAFLSASTGVVLTARPDARSGEPGYALHRREERICRAERMGLALCLLVCCAGAFLPAPQLSSATLALRVGVVALSAVGLALSWLLLLRQLHVPASMADRICGRAGRDGCSAVARTAGSRLFGRYGWSEVGLAYFAVSAAVALFWPSQLFWLAVTAAASLPYTLWSIGYQRLRARSWCGLCLAVMAVLWGLFALHAVMGSFALPFPGWAGLALLLAACGAGGLAVHVLTDLYDRAREASKWKWAYAALKRRKELFFALLASRPAIPVAEASTLLFGPAAAAHTVTVFSNPHCNPCARLHAALHALPEGGEWRVQYVLTSFNDELLETNRRIVATYLRHGPDAAWQLLDRWYATHDPALLRGIGPEESHTAEVEAELERHRAWSRANGLMATPHVLVDGRPLPPPYRGEDLATLA